MADSCFSRCWVSPGQVLAGRGGGDVVGGDDDLHAGSRHELLVDEDDGTGRTARVGDLRSGVGGDGIACGNGSGGNHDESVGSCGDVEISGVGVEVDVVVDGGDVCELLAGRHEI